MHALISSETMAIFVKNKKPVSRRFYVSGCRSRGIVCNGQENWYRITTLRPPQTAYLSLSKGFLLCSRKHPFKIPKKNEHC